VNTIQSFKIALSRKNFHAFHKVQDWSVKVKTNTDANFLPSTVVSLGCNDGRKLSTQTHFKVNCKEMQHSVTVIHTIPIYNPSAQRYLAAQSCIISR